MVHPLTPALSLKGEGAGPPSIAAVVLPIRAGRGGAAPT